GVQTCALPIWADDATQLAFINIQVQIIQRPKTIETDGGSCNVENRTVSGIQGCSKIGIILTERAARLSKDIHQCVSSAGLSAGVSVGVLSLRLNRPTSPTRPLGKTSVTSTNSEPSTSSQASGDQDVKMVLP